VRPKSGQRGQATWMQTTGVSLLVVKRCSVPCVRVPAQDSRRAHRLLYLAAVQAVFARRDARQASAGAEAWRCRRMSTQRAISHATAKGTQRGTAICRRLRSTLTTTYVLTAG
jgi:hypothetical protein